MTKQSPTQIDPRIFKDTGGRQRTRSLFKELETDDYPSFFTLADSSTDTHVSVRAKYMEYSDPTEYRVALALLGSFDHWETLCRLPWFKVHVDKWRKELVARITSEAVAKSREISTGNGTAALSAAKWLATQGWRETGNKRGRPGKHELSREAKRLAELRQDVAADTARIKSG